MYELNPERNSKNMPPLNHKTALHFSVWKKPLVILFKLIIDSQPSYNVRNSLHNIHNMRQIVFHCCSKYLCIIIHMNVRYYILKDKVQSYHIWPWPIRLYITAHNRIYRGFRRIKPLIFRDLLGFKRWNSPYSFYLCLSSI